MAYSVRIYRIIRRKTIFLQILRRVGHYYVGSGPTKGKVIEKLKGRVCPVECRPTNHKDWKYC